MYILSKTMTIIFSIFIFFQLNSLFAQEYQGPATGTTILSSTVSVGSLPSGNVEELIDNSFPNSEKILEKSNSYSINKNISNITSTTAENLIINFNGINTNFTAEPPDPVIASGNNQYIVLAVNKCFAIYKKDGTFVKKINFSDFFGVNHNNKIYDPKIIYDHYNDRWVLLALYQDDTNHISEYLIGVSMGMYPTGSWYIYKSIAKNNGSNNSDLWPDYPGLGYDEKAIYITSAQHEYPKSNGTFKYTKIRIFNKNVSLR